MTTINSIKSNKSPAELWGDWQQNGDLPEADRQCLWEFLVTCGEEA